METQLEPIPDTVFDPGKVAVSDKKILEAEVIALAQLREKLSDIKLSMNELIDEVYRSQLWIDLDTELAKIVEQEKSQYKRVTELAVDLFKIDGDKHPHLATTVEEKKTIHVFDETALWVHCRSSLTKAIIPESLDMDLVKKAAIAMQDISPVPGVEVLIETKAKVSTNLNAYLPAR